MRIYLDVDDTLVDFRGHCVASGVPDWSGSFYTQPGETWSEEQRAIDAAVIAQMERPDFWPHIPLRPGAHELIAAAALRAETFLLTALPRSHAKPEMVRRQKFMYCRDVLHFPAARIIICQRPEKVQYATYMKGGCSNPGGEVQPNLLIDDAEQNCMEWRDAGGLAFHYHGDKHDNILHLLKNGL